MTKSDTNHSKTEAGNACVKTYLLEECFAMIKHISALGKDIPLNANKIIDYSKDNCNDLELDAESVLRLHKELSRKISPALPKTIWVLYKESRSEGVFTFLGPVKLIRRLMLVALISLAAFMIYICCYGVKVEQAATLFAIPFFYLSAASLGATFSALFQVNRYIVNNTFDPKYETSYWIRYVLGLIAGVLLATIIEIPEDNPSHFQMVSRPILAMLGGFSASLVYRILFRLVYAVESIFIGKASEESEKKIELMRSAHENELAYGRLQELEELYALQQMVEQGQSGDQLNEFIQSKIDQLK